jgi:hypothetical protein
MGLLLGWFERSRFRIRRVGVSRRWFSGRNDHTSLGSRDDDGALRIGQLRRDADYRGVVDAINKARIMHTRNIQRVPPSAALVVIAKAITPARTKKKNQLRPHDLPGRNEALDLDGAGLSAWPDRA